jgi:aerobic-type carbon monoxide dehydrogenase small subunit (CoxS/CutS family)
MAERIKFKINSKNYLVEVEPWETLNYVLREKLGLTGTKKGCETGGCGSCTVVVNGKAVYSCMTLAYQVANKEIITVEGRDEDNILRSLRKGFMEMGGLQCGYCTPGFIMSSYALLMKNRKPSRSEIKQALIGNLCRCTGYVKIFESVERASQILDEMEKHD